MTITSERFEVTGEFMGMPLIRETGICSGQKGVIDSLKDYELQGISFEPVPRRAGLVVKALNGGTIKTKKIAATFDTTAPGVYPKCVQYGRTVFQQIAPRQPSTFPRFGGYVVYSYERVWVSIEA